MAESLRNKGINDATVYVGMRYWHPYTEEAMDQVWISVGAGVFIEDVRQQMCGKGSGLRGKGGVTGEIHMEGAEYHRVGVEADLREGQILSQLQLP